MEKFKITDDGVMNVETGEVFPSSSKENSNLEEYDEWRSQIGNPSFLEKCRHKISYIVWRQYRRLIRLTSKNSYMKLNLDSEFRKNELKIGELSPADLNLLWECIKRSPLLPRTSHDCISGYYYDEHAGTLEKGWANHFRFFDLKKETKNIKNVLSNIAPTIRSCLGHPFRIANMNCWGMMPSSDGFGSNAWHNDGFPPGMYKLLIYLNPPGRETGTSEVRLPDGSSTIIEGPAGTWVLFNSTTLLHRGLPASSVERTIINVTIVPAFKESVYPVIAGVRANFPWFPWSIPNHDN